MVSPVDNRWEERGNKALDNGFNQMGNGLGAKACGWIDAVIEKSVRVAHRRFGPPRKEEFVAQERLRGDFRREREFAEQQARKRLCELNELVDIAFAPSEVDQKGEINFEAQQRRAQVRANALENLQEGVDQFEVRGLDRMIDGEKRFIEDVKECRRKDDEQCTVM